MKTCIKCSEIKEYDLFVKDRNTCKVCKKEYLKEHYKNNSEKLEAYRKEWDKNNSEKVNEYRKKYRKNNPEELKAKSKEHYKNNSQKVKARGKKYRENNPEKVKAKNKEWVKNNPEILAKHSLIAKGFIKSQITAELIECQLLITKTNRLWKTSHN